MSASMTEHADVAAPVAMYCCLVHDHSSGSPSHSVYWLSSFCFHWIFAAILFPR